MTYEKAKQLKDAGFPVKEHDDDGINPDYPFHITLSELIEACGEMFGSLNFQGGKSWVAVGWKNDKPITADGSNPEETVANLWIELHKNDQKGV